MDLATFLKLDFPAFATAALAAAACGLIGSFLVLRRMSLMGDAISHAVLPGIVMAFLLSNSLQALPVFIGAAAVGILTSVLTEAVHRLGKVEPGAAMGVVFTVLFAIGVIWLEQIGGRNVHLDADCVLYGNMQGVIWPAAPETLAGLFTLDAAGDMPREVVTLAIVLLVNVIFVGAFFKELRITSFDPGLAASQGINPHLMHYLLMTVVAITTVAAFEAVGSILVVAMLIVPGVAAHLFTDRLGPMLILSVVLAVAATGGGYAGGAMLSLDTTGMIGVALGVLLIAAGFLSPRHGWTSRLLRRMALTISIQREDMLAALYRAGELAPANGPQLASSDLRAAVGGGISARMALWRLGQRGEARLESGLVRLTGSGAAAASNLVRSHRLWESYLVRRLGLQPDHVHDAAMRLEHVTDETMRDDLAARVEHESTDPHGRMIPESLDQE